MIWHHIEKGQGRPLVLLHGIGMSSAAWMPIMERLSIQRRVIAFDIPGFGNTPSLDASIEPTSEAMVASLKQSLEMMGINEPVDMVGNSLGGRIILDAAADGMARSIVCISPAGLWREKGPGHIEHLFGAMRQAYKVMPKVSEALLKNSVGRTVLMMGAVSAKGWKMPAQDAINAARMFADSHHFDPIFEAFRPPFMRADEIAVPCTIAFGSLDMVFPAPTRDKSRAPKHTHWVKLPGCGHVPMWDNPDHVSHVILHATQ